MRDVRLAFEEDDPPLRLMLPEGLTDTALAAFATAIEHTGLAEDPAQAAATLLALRDRLPSVDPVFSEPTTLTLVRCSLEQLAARHLWQVDEHERSRMLVLGCVTGLAALLDTVGDTGGDTRSQEVMALWLSARFDLYWCEVLAPGRGVATEADLATTIGTTRTATRDGRLEVRSGFGLMSRWVGFFSSAGLSDFARMLREHLVDLATERFGPLDPVTLALRRLEAEILESQGHLEQAWECFEHLLRDLEHAGETGGALAMQVRAGHASLAGTRGSSARAVQLHRALLADLEAGLLTGDSTGPFDIHAPMAETSISALDLVRMNLSTWLTDRGELEEAVPLLEQVVERAIRTALEPDEPFDDAAETLRTVQHELGVDLRDLGRHAESVPR